MSAASIMSTIVNDPAGHFVRSFTASINQFLPVGVISFPKLHPPLPQEIFIIQFQFFKAGASNLGKLYFELLRRRRALRALGNILHSRASDRYKIMNYKLCVMNGRALSAGKDGRKNLKREKDCHPERSRGIYSWCNVIKMNISTVHCLLFTTYCNIHPRQ